MVKKFALMIIILMCMLISSHELKAETLAADTTIQGMTFTKGTEVYFYKSGQLHYINLPQDQVVCNIHSAKGMTEFYESGKLKSAFLSQDAVVGGLSFSKGTEIFFYETGTVKVGTLSGNQEIRGIPCAKGEVKLTEAGDIIKATLANDKEINGVRYGQSTHIWMENNNLREAVLANEQKIAGISLKPGTTIQFADTGQFFIKPPENIEIQGIPCARGEWAQISNIGKLVYATLPSNCTIQGIPCIAGQIVLHSSGKLETTRLSEEYSIQDMKFSKGTELRFSESGKLSFAKLGEAQEIQGIKFIKGSLINFDDSGKIILAGLQRSPEIQGIICEKGSIESYESGKLKSGRLLREQNVQGVKFPRGTGIHLLESGELMSVWLIQDYEMDGMKFAKGSVLSFCKSGKISSGVLSGDQIVQNIPCAKGAIEFSESGKLMSSVLSENSAIQDIRCAGSEKISFYESGKLKKAVLSEDQNIQNIACAKGEIELYESGKPKNCILAQDKELEGIRCFKDSKISLSESGKLDSNTLTAQKYLKEYDNVTIKYSVPKFLENNNIVCLKTINCWNSWGGKTSLKEIKIVEMNLKDPQEKILFQIAPKTGSDRWEFDDFPRFDINPKGTVGILEPALDFSNPEAMKITVIDLGTKKASTITRRGTSYRISPNGKFMIYGDIGNSSNNYSDKKTLYLTDIRGTSREAVYETQDSILSFCWINEGTIAVYCDSKEGPYVKFVDTQTRGILDSIVSEYYKGSILVSSDGSAIILDDNKLFVKKDTAQSLLRTVQSLPYLNSNERLNGINKKWNCYTIIARNIAISSWSSDNEFTVGSNLDGNLLLTDFKTFETKVLKRGYKKY